ncbi:hypothetical protein ACWGI9_22890 [Streptomyces sp. NPDC054833]
MYRLGEQFGPQVRARWSSQHAIVYGIALMGVTSLTDTGPATQNTGPLAGTAGAPRPGQLAPRRAPAEPWAALNAVRFAGCS